MGRLKELHHIMKDLFVRKGQIALKNQFFFIFFRTGDPTL